MPKRKLFVALFGFVLLLSISAQPVFGIEKNKVDDNKNKKVVIVSIPRVSWEDISRVDLPNIEQLVEVGSVANLSIRVNRPGRTLEKGYATISSGDKISVAPSSLSTFYDPNESTKFGKAVDVFNNERGILNPNAGALALGFESSLNLNSNDKTTAVIGAFAQALNESDKSIGIVGNADTCQIPETRCKQRGIAYLGVDRNGIVSNGEVGPNLLSSSAPIRSNYKEVLKATTKSIKENDVTAVECSDLERIDQEVKNMSETIFERSKVEALKQCDSLVGRVVSKINLEKDRLYIVAPMSTSVKEQLSVFIEVGNGVKPGYASSGITRRIGIVALADIAPSILEFLGVERPETMVDTLIENRSSESSVDTRVDELISVNDGAIIRDQAFNLVATVFISLVFLSVIVCVLAYKKFKQLIPVAKFLLLISMAMPLVSFLIHPLMTTLESPVSILSIFIACSAFIASIGFFVGSKFGYLIVIFAIAFSNVVLHVLDMIFGGTLQLNSLFGYSAIVAGRFAGLGNMSFAILSVSTVVLVACVSQFISDRKFQNELPAKIGLLVFMFVILLCVGLPYLGSDVGGVLALTPTIFVIGFLLFDRKIDLKLVALTAVSTIATITVFSIFDLNRPTSERSHLGRFVEVLLNGEAGVVIQRKISSNLAIFSNSVIGSIVIISTVVLLFLYLHPERYYRRVANQVIAIKFIVLPTIVLGTLGMLLNDSGIAIPGMMAAIVIPSLALISFDIKENSNPTRHLSARVD